YSMGKVGSTSVYESLMPHDLNGPLYHVHILTRSGLDRAAVIYRTIGKPKTLATLLSATLSQEFRRRRAHVRWNIITLVREPIATMLSQLFYSPDVSLRHLSDREGTIPLDRAVEFARTSLAKGDPSQWSVNTWFDTEFRESTGINIYDYK